MHMSKAERVVGYMIENGISVSSAESCTGGLFAKTLTDISGVSAIFPGGVVSYSNEVKENLLGVRADTLASVGAVSEDTARQMAQGVRRLMGTDIGVSATGIAGPNSDGTDKPVGLVYIALDDKDGTTVVRLDLNGDRSAIRQGTVSAIFDLIAERILK